MEPAELLNRWIVPLEKHYDILNLPNGITIQVPFDQLLIFSTNLQPRDLVDEAFLRRIPYKVQVGDPSDDDFRKLARQHARALGIRHHEPVVEYLMQKHFADCERKMRYCHARDLMHQVYTYCNVLDLPMELTNEAVDAAARNYFAVL
jgi:Mg-chelatase subunit ChlI